MVQVHAVLPLLTALLQSESEKQDILAAPTSYKNVTYRNTHMMVLSLTLAALILGPLMI